MYGVILIDCVRTCSWHATHLTFHRIYDMSCSPMDPRLIDMSYMYMYIHMQPHAHTHAGRDNTVIGEVSKINAETDAQLKLLVSTRTNNK